MPPPAGQIRKSNEHNPEKSQATVFPLNELTNLPHHNSTLFPYTTLFRSTFVTLSTCDIPESSAAGKSNTGAAGPEKSVVNVKKPGADWFPATSYRDRESTRLNSTHTARPHTGQLWKSNEPNPEKSQATVFPVNELANVPYLNYSDATPLNLHSFPTRRSSDLDIPESSAAGKSNTGAAGPEKSVVNVKKPGADWFPATSY